MNSRIVFMTKLSTRRFAVTFKENLTPDSTDKSSIMFDFYFTAALIASFAVMKVAAYSMLLTRDSWSTPFCSLRLTSNRLITLTSASFYKCSSRLF